MYLGAVKMRINKALLLVTKIVRKLRNNEMC